MKSQSFGAALWHAAVLAGMLAVAGCAEVTDSDVKQELPVFPPPPEQPRFYYEGTIYSSADVEQEEEYGGFRRLATGESRTGEGLAKPYGVAVRHGRVYVTDTVRRSVLLFDIPGRKFVPIGAEDPGALRLPLGLDVDGAGNIYVVDGTNKVVQVYDTDGKYLRELGKPEQFSRPSGIAVDKAGTRVYVVDTGGVDKPDHRVRVLDAHNGALLFDIGKRGDKPGEFNLARDAVISPDGLLYVVDGGNFRVQVFDLDGKFLRTFGSIGRQGGQFSRPKEVAVDAAGNVYIVDAAFGNFQIFNKEGQLLLDVGSRANEDGPAKYMLPSGISIDDDGRVYMVDQFFRKVDVYRPAGLDPKSRPGMGTAPAQGAPATPAK